MNAATASAAPPAAHPGWRRLMPLTLGVLLVHLVLLSGGWSGDLNTVFGTTTSTTTDPGATLTPREAAPAATVQPETPVPAATSRVRWIVLAPLAPPEPAAKAEPEPPKPLPEPEPEPKAEPEPEPVPDPPVEALAEPEPLPEPPLELLAEPPPEPMVEPLLGPETTASLTDTPGADATPLAETPVPPETPAATETGPVASTLAPAASTPATGLLPGDAELPPALAPPSIRLMYQVTGRVKGINYNAAGALEWTNEGSRYNAYMAVRAFLAGSRGQTSIGTLGTAGLVPERFIDKSRKERVAEFDAAQRRIRFSNNAPEADWLPGGQDRLSAFLQISSLMRARPEAYQEGTSITLQVAGPGDAELWRFDIGPEETLELPAGNLRARLVTRAPRKAFDTRTELWLAPDLHHLPVRIRITQTNGDHIEQVLRYMP